MTEIDGRPSEAERPKSVLGRLSALRPGGSKGRWRNGTVDDAAVRFPGGFFE